MVVVTLFNPGCIQFGRTSRGIMKTYGATATKMWMQAFMRCRFTLNCIQEDVKTNLEEKLRVLLCSQRYDSHEQILQYSKQYLLCGKGKKNVLNDLLPIEFIIFSFKSGNSLHSYRYVPSASLFFSVDPENIVGVWRKPLGAASDFINDVS